MADNELRLFATTDALDPAVIEVTAQEVVDDVVNAHAGLTAFGVGFPFVVTPAPIGFNPFSSILPQLNMTASAATGQITVAVAGTYEVHLSCSGFDPVAANTDYWIQLGHNGVPVATGFLTGSATIALNGAGAAHTFRQALIGDVFDLMISAPVGVAFTATSASLIARKIGL